MSRVSARRPDCSSAELQKPKAARPAALAGALDPATALRLQATAGNRAVAGLARERTLARLKKPTKAEKAAADFATARTAADWTGAVGALGRMDEGAAVVLMRGCPTADVTSIASIAKPLTAKKAQRVYRLARFVLKDPGAAAVHADQATVTTKGKLGGSAKVPGGKIKVRTGGQVTMSGGSTLDEPFTLSYEGTSAPRTRWLQFIWRELIATDPVKGRHRVAGAITTSGGSYSLTTDPKSPSFNTDSAPGAGGPFYEAGFLNNRSATNTTIFDQPGAMNTRVDAAFDAGATKVTSRAHFTTYLVRDWKVLDRAKINVEWKFTAKGQSPARRQSACVLPASKLEKGHRDRLIAQFPDYDYLP